MQVAQPFVVLYKVCRAHTAQLKKDWMKSGMKDLKKEKDTYDVTTNR